MSDPHRLARFVDAQRGTWPRAIAELRAGHKRSHWMWFVLPQVQGLGRSETARHYAVTDLDEARAYLAHDVLGPRLHEACEALLQLDTTSAEEVLGGIDAQKLRSSMTLFARADPADPVFAHVLEKYFDGEPDDATDRLLNSPSG